jgi:Fic-DOC domain mobile mystery protein B
MSDPLFDEDDDANTPLTAEEREGLIPTYIALRAELNEAEQIGIANAERWAFGRRRVVIETAFLQQLHERMFGDVWKWAGQFRTSARNIGIDAYRIPVELRSLCDDTRYQIANTTYAPDEIAIRFHHRLVFNHAFPNGNGRHARLAADLLARQMGAQRFTWGSANLVSAAEARKRYVEALRAADAHDITALLAFARG